MLQRLRYCTFTTLPCLSVGTEGYAKEWLKPIKHSTCTGRVSCTTWLPNVWVSMPRFVLMHSIINTTQNRRGVFGQLLHKHKRGSSHSGLPFGIVVRVCCSTSFSTSDSMSSGSRVAAGAKMRGTAAERRERQQRNVAAAQTCGHYDSAADSVAALNSMRHAAPSD
jgi:hypothetical protein